MATRTNAELLSLSGKRIKVTPRWENQVGKKRPADRGSFDSAIQARLQEIGPHELVTDPGYTEIHFSSLLGSTNGLPDFNVSWFISGPGRSTQVPKEGLFDLWLKYQTAHADMCEVYRQFLWGLFEKSSLVNYDDLQWQVLRRSRPTPENMKSVVNSAEIRLEQQRSKGEASTTFQIQLAFAVFWDSHGIAVRLNESEHGFDLGEWAGIGDL